MKKIIRLGTRGSPLALIQAEDVRKHLLAAYPQMATEAEIEIIPIRTTGDWRPEHKERSFIDLGGNKSLFTKEIEEALQSGHIDIAVHSMKDLESKLPDGLEIAAMLERADCRDAFISTKAKTLAELPKGSVVGTASLRRQSQILAARPDLRVTPLRGNVETRLKKLADGLADATILAVAGLSRLSLDNRITSIMDAALMLPCAGQGALGVQIRRGDKEMAEILKPLNHKNTWLCVTAERAALKVLDGSCETPIGALAQISGPDQLTIEALVARPDGTDCIRLSQSGAAKDAEAIGAELGAKLKGRLPANFFAA